MKKKFFLILMSMIGGVTMFNSCKKDTDHSSSSSYKPPIANAGPDIFITQVPCGLLNWTELDGSGSFSPGDSIVYYEWEKISGPSAGTVSNNGDAKAIALDLRAGLYSFELLVKDSRGLSSRDTMFVDATDWSLPEYDLDITINGSFEFYDNWEDCDDFPESPCRYNDITTIEGNGNFSPLGQFNLYVSEVADSSASSDNHFTRFNLTSVSNTGNVTFVNGNCSVCFKRLVQDGERAFNGTFDVYEGSAQACTQKVFNNFPPLTISGSLDTTAHTVTLNIKGKIYF